MTSISKELLGGKEPSLLDTSSKRACKRKSAFTTTCQDYQFTCIVNDIYICTGIGLGFLNLRHSD